MKRSTFHVMQLYANELQPNVLSLTIKSDLIIKGDKFTPVVDALATCSDSKKQMVNALVNKDPE